MDYGGIADAGAVALSSVLPQSVVLAEVNLSINAIGDAGGVALAAALPHCTIELHTFMLRANVLGDKTMDEFSKTLKHFSSLRKLALRR